MGKDGKMRQVRRRVNPDGTAAARKVGTAPLHPLSALMVALSAAEHEHIPCQNLQGSLQTSSQQPTWAGCVQNTDQASLAHASTHMLIHSAHAVSDDAMHIRHLRGLHMKLLLRGYRLSWAGRLQQIMQHH